MLLDAVGRYDAKLTAERLFGWQAALFPTGFSGLHRLAVGRWRDDAGGPMQVVSGPIGRQWVHYEAPPAAVVDAEMARFLDWFNAPPQVGGTAAGGPGASVVRDRASVRGRKRPGGSGNGRSGLGAVGRIGAAVLRSMSRQIRLERNGWAYSALEQTQKGGLDVTEWLVWFLGCLSRAIDAAGVVREAVLQKAVFWDRFGALPMSARQRTVLNQVLDNGFEGKTQQAKEWAVIGKCSVPTAQRDILEMVAWGALRRGPGGSRNTSYEVVVQGGMRSGRGLDRNT